MQENWQMHEESIDPHDRVIGYTCLGPELIRTEREYCDWASADVIGYSWFKDDQFAATKDLPFFDAMMSRPPEINLRGGRPSLKISTDKQPTPPPSAWTPYLTKYARHRLGVPTVSTPHTPLVDAASMGGDDPTGARPKSGGDSAEASVGGGVDPTVGINVKGKRFNHVRIEGRCDADVIEYGAIAATAWIVDTGASYDSVLEGLVERRGWKRAPWRTQ